MKLLECWVSFYQTMHANALRKECMLCSLALLCKLHVDPHSQCSITSIVWFDTDRWLASDSDRWLASEVWGADMPGEGTRRKKTLLEGVPCW